MQWGGCHYCIGLHYVVFLYCNHDSLQHPYDCVLIPTEKSHHVAGDVVGASAGSVAVAVAVSEPIEDCSRAVAMRLDSDKKKHCQVQQVYDHPRSDENYRFSQSCVL